MQQISFAIRMGLRPGDVVIVPKSEFNMVAHYVVYWGKDANGIHFYMENNNKVGVRYITEEVFLADNPTYKRLRLFNGNETERILAVNRGTSLIGSIYNIDKFNCENFANYVQYGVSFSKQVDNVKGVVIVAGIALLLGGLGGLFGE